MYIYIYILGILLLLLYITIIANDITVEWAHRLPGSSLWLSCSFSLKPYIYIYIHILLLGSF